MKTWCQHYGVVRLSSPATSTGRSRRPSLDQTDLLSLKGDLMPAVIMQDPAVWRGHQLRAASGSKASVTIIKCVKVLSRSLSHNKCRWALHIPHPIRQGRMSSQVVQQMSFSCEMASHVYVKSQGNDTGVEAHGAACSGVDRRSSTGRSRLMITSRAGARTTRESQSDVARAHAGTTRMRVFQIVAALAALSYVASLLARAAPGARCHRVRAMVVQRVLRAHDPTDPAPCAPLSQAWCRLDVDRAVRDPL